MRQTLLNIALVVGILGFSAVVTQLFARARRLCGRFTGRPDVQAGWGLERKALRPQTCPRGHPLQRRSAGADRGPSAGYCADSILAPRWRAVPSEVGSRPWAGGQIGKSKVSVQKTKVKTEVARTLELCVLSFDFSICPPAYLPICLSVWLITRFRLWLRPPAGTLGSTRLFPARWSHGSTRGGRQLSSRRWRAPVPRRFPWW